MKLGFVFVSGLSLGFILCSFVFLHNYQTATFVYSRSKPAFVLLSERRHHLKLLLDSLDVFGFQEIEESFDVSRFSLMWSFKAFPFHKISNVPNSATLFVNHFKGSFYLCKKGRLFRTYSKARLLHGPALFNFIPDHFMTSDKQVVLNWIKLQPTKSGDSDFDRRWVLKSVDHGGVELFSNVSKIPESSMISKYIEPLLIDNYKWDFGLYVVIVSVDPLIVFVHRNGLVRMCTKEYPAFLDRNTDLSRYIIKDYSPAWERRSLFKYYVGNMPDDSNQGAFHSNAVCDYIGSHSKTTCAQWWESMKTAAIKMILVTLDKFRSIEPLHHKFSFELFRMDFNTDFNGKPWLVEVNMSPNLQPKVFGTRSDAAMKRSVILNTLRMVSPHGVKDAPNPFILSLHNSCEPVHNTLDIISDINNIQCILQALAEKQNIQQNCSFCLKDDVIQAIGDAAFTYYNRGDFELAFPNIIDKSTAALAPNGLLDQVLFILFRNSRLLIDNITRIYHGGECYTYGNCNKGLACIAGRCI